MCRAIFRLSLLLLAAVIGRAQPSALSVNPVSREEVRQFFRTVYHASENAAMGWTGSYTTGSAGDTAAAFKEATRLRINFYRALVGVPADITFSPIYNAKAQQAALLMSVNDALSHTPPASWVLYSAVAAEAAANSNLALGQAGPDAIDGYITDAGDNNAVVGHRRWLFYPQTLQMGAGDVPGLPGSASVRAANAVWVIDGTPGGQYGALRPTTRTLEVPYPPAGYVPYQLVWPRWSFSYPGADFSAATVTMLRDGLNISVTREALATSPVGEPTLVWAYDRRDATDTAPHARPALDMTYTVAINNVKIAGAVRNFSYNVTVFDPDTASADFAPVGINGPALPSLGVANSYSVAKPSFAPGFDWRTVQLSPVSRTFTAESGLEGLVATTSGGYDVVQGATIATGARAYRLAHSTRAEQVLLVPGTYLVDGDGQVAFRSRLAIATETETARVQVSTDDGMSWIDVFAQVGTSPTNTGFPAPTETAFVTRALPLSAYAGRTISIRFVYSIGVGSAFVPAADNIVGWFLDDLMLDHVQAVVAGTPERVAKGSTFTFTPLTGGGVGLQARGLMFGAYPMEWGAITPVSAVNNPVAQGGSYLSNLSVRTTAGTGAETLIVGFTVSGGTKPVLVRSIGPALATFGISGALVDPLLGLYREGTQIAENDNWIAADAATFKGVGAFELPAGSRDSAIVLPLAPSSYTAQVSGTGGGTGVALVELYDAGRNAPEARLTNVSARSQVGVAGNVLIAGFAISGTGPRTLLIRAVGPTLGDFGVAGALSDPKLELFNAGGKIQENDNWDAAARDTFASVGAFELPAGSRDAVLLVTLPPGSYTAQVTGMNGATGVALVEVYEVPLVSAPAAQ